MLADIMQNCSVEWPTMIMTGNLNKLNSLEDL
jgi:hypothetical protein